MLKIVFKNGDVMVYQADEYTDYSYDSKCFIVIKGRQWIGIYNMDCVSCVEFEPERDEE